MHALVVFMVFSLADVFSVRLTAAEPSAPKPSSIHTLYLVRHGNYEENQPGDESVVKGLTPLGLAQARLIAARLRALPVTFTSLTSSTYTRARQTAGVIGEEFPALELKQDPLLCECLPRTHVPQKRPDANENDFTAAEAQLNQAFAKFFIPAHDHDAHDLLICHGNVIRWFVTKALQVDTQAWLGFSVAHASLTIIQIKPDGTCKVLAVGDSGHIPPNLLSGLTRAPEPQLVPP